MIVLDLPGVSMRSLSAAVSAQPENLILLQNAGEIRAGWLS